jgi:hypothetical protein
MQIKIIVDTGYACNWREIEPLQPEGFKGQTANEKETLKNSIMKNGFHDAFDVWQHDGKLLSIDGVHRKIALLELAAEGYEIPEQLPCTYVTAANETEAATIILSRNSQHSHIIRAAKLMEAYSIPAATIEAVVPQKNLEAWSETQPSYENSDVDYSDKNKDIDVDDFLDEMILKLNYTSEEYFAVKEELSNRGITAEAALYKYLFGDDEQ